MRSRIAAVEIKLCKEELCRPIPKEIETPDGSKFEIVVSKVQSDGVTPNGDALL